MKKLLIIILCLGSYGIWKQRQASEPKAPEVTEEQVSVPEKVTPSVKPAPAPRSEPSIITQEPAKRMAPNGIYYLLYPISIPTDSGVIGIRVGTGVRLISESGEGMKVTDGRNEFTVGRNYLTNELDRVPQIVVTPTPAPIPQVVHESAPPISVQRIDPRPAQIASLRAQIAKEEDRKGEVSKGNPKYQKHLNAQNEKIRALQKELGLLGVAGASLERR